MIATPLERCILKDDEQEQESQALIPIEQQTITFRNRPIVVVRLPDGRPGVVLRWICENLHIDPAAQVARIKRTEIIAGDLVSVQVQTEGGFQTMPTLVLDAAPYWLATIDTKRVKDQAQRLEILHYQKEAVAALYVWASSHKAIEAPKNLVPAEPITKPTTPEDDAPLASWREYYQRMLALVDWQMDIETWRGSVEDRLEGVEAVTDLIPEILERLGPPTISPAHQNLVKYYVEELRKATGKTRGAIYSNLYTAFEVPRYQELLEDEWSRIEQWFTTQIEQAHKQEQRKEQKRPAQRSQETLFDDPGEPGKQ